MATKEDQREYQRFWMKMRRVHYLKKYGPCLFCGSDKNLHIHHIDHSKKNTRQIWSWTPERIEKELQGCKIICQKCHSTYHTLVKKRPLIHGTRYAYKSYDCKCQECLKAHSEYNMAHR